MISYKNWRENNFNDKSFQQLSKLSFNYDNQMVIIRDHQQSTIKTERERESERVYCRLGKKVLMTINIFRFQW